MTDTTRRAMVMGAGGVGVAALLTACGGGSGEPAGTGASTAASAPQANPSSGAASEGAGGGGVLAKTADIPEGGGKVFKAEKVVVTQPKAGEFKAFSSVCPHRGCDVASISGGTINCPCHGSKFNISDGSVTNGPADKPLPEKTIKVENGSITLG